MSADVNGSAREIRELRRSSGFSVGYSLRIEVLDRLGRKTRVDTRVAEAGEMLPVGLGALGQHGDLGAEPPGGHRAVDHAAAVEGLDLAPDQVPVDAHVANERDLHASSPSAFDLPRWEKIHSEAANSVDSTSAPIQTVNTSLKE